LTITFADVLDQAIQKTNSVAVVGLDPKPELIPHEVQENVREKLKNHPSKTLFHAACYHEFCEGILKTVAGFVPAVKPNIAFFEALGIPGLTVYNLICKKAKEIGLLVIGDVKRGDIGATAEAYAQALLSVDKQNIGENSDDGQLGIHDAITLNPYLGSDSIEPFIKAAEINGQGLFILVKTSNPSSSAFSSKYI